MKNFDTNTNKIYKIWEQILFLWSELLQDDVTYLYPPCSNINIVAPDNTLLFQTPPKPDQFFFP